MAPRCWKSSRAHRRAAPPREASDSGPHQAPERPGRAALREYLAFERPLRHLEMLGQQPLHDGSQVERRLEIPILIQLPGREPRPIRDHSTAPDGPAEEIGCGRGAMIRAA